jgi:hypothetical protein
MLLKKSTVGAGDSSMVWAFIKTKSERSYPGELLDQQLR